MIRRVRIKGAPETVKDEDGNGKRRVKYLPNRRALERVAALRGTRPVGYLRWGRTPTVRDAIEMTPVNSFCRVRVDQRRARYEGPCGNRSCLKGCAAAWFVEVVSRGVAAWAVEGYVSVPADDITIRFEAGTDVNDLIDALLNIPLTEPEKDDEDAEPAVPTSVDSSHLTTAQRRAIHAAIGWDPGGAYIRSGLGWRKAETEPTDEQWERYVRLVIAARRAPPLADAVGF